MNWGAVLGAGIKGVGAAVESRDDRTRELLIESERQRKAQREDSVLNARVKREEQDAADDATDRANKEAERIKKEIADAAEAKRRETELPLRVRIARDLVPEFKDETKYDGPTLQSYLADDDNWKGIMSRVGKPESAPSRGTPEYLSMIEDEAVVRERVQQRFPNPQQPTTEPSWQVVETDEGIKQVNPKTGEVRDVIQAGRSLQKPIPAPVQEKQAANRQLISGIDAAIQLIERNPRAIGLEKGRGIMDAVDQRVDPGGVAVRAAIAEIGSGKLHERSGAAVSPAEWARLAPFLPTSRDNAQAAVTKLKQLKAQAVRETAARNGSASGGSASADRAAALRKKYGIN